LTVLPCLQHSAIEADRRVKAPLLRVINTPIYRTNSVEQTWAALLGTNDFCPMIYDHLGP